MREGIVLSEKPLGNYNYQDYEGTMEVTFVTFEKEINGNKGPHLWIKNNGKGARKMNVHLEGEEIVKLKDFLNELGLEKPEGKDRK